MCCGQPVVNEQWSDIHYGMHMFDLLLLVCTFGCNVLDAKLQKGFVGLQLLDGKLLVAS